MRLVNSLMDTSNVIVVGAGGHARALVSLAELNQLKVLAVIDDAARPNELIMGKPVVPSIDHFDIKGNFEVIIGVGDNSVRKRHISYWKDNMYKNVLLHPSTILDKTAIIGHCCQVFAGVFVGPLANIGENVLVNTHAIIEHEVTVGSHSHISVGAKLLGRSSVGEFSFVGAGAVVRDGVRICDGVTVGANSFVNRDIAEPGVYVGAPVRKVDDR